MVSLENLFSWGGLMTVFVYQTFVIKQDKFKEGIDNLKAIKKFRNDQYDHKVEILSPVSGKDHTYSLLTKYEGLAEMEFQNKKMFEDEEYLKLIEDFFLQNIAQGSMYTQIYRTMTETYGEKKKEKK
jgi:hypothetical protein